MKLTDIKESGVIPDYSDEAIEKEWVERITAAINNAPEPDLSKLENIPDEGMEYFYDVARVIVEPGDMSEKADDAYDNYINISSEQWVTWIKSNFGDTWGKIAALVDEQGY